VYPHLVSTTLTSVGCSCIMCAYTCNMNAIRISVCVCVRVCVRIHLSPSVSLCSDKDWVYSFSSWVCYETHINELHHTSCQSCFVIVLTCHDVWMHFSDTSHAYGLSLSITCVFILLTRAHARFPCTCPPRVT